MLTCCHIAYAENQNHLIAPTQEQPNKAIKVIISITGIEGDLKKNALAYLELKKNLNDLIGEFLVKQKANQLMTGNGELHLINGTFRAYGQDLTIDKGRIFYTGGYLDNPGLKLTASRKVSDTQVGIKVSGLVKKSDIICVGGLEFPVIYTGFRNYVSSMG